MTGGYLLTFEFGLGPRGLWWGLVIGLGLVAVIFLLRVRTMLRRRIDRVRIDSMVELLGKSTRLILRPTIAHASSCDRDGQRIKAMPCPAFG